MSVKAHFHGEPWTPILELWNDHEVFMLDHFSAGSEGAILPLPR